MKAIPGTTSLLIFLITAIGYNSPGFEWQELSRPQADLSMGNQALAQPAMQDQQWTAALQMQHYA